MIKKFYIVIDTNQSDIQCIREFEHAVGEITSIRPIVLKKVEHTHACDVCGADLSPNHPLKND